MILAATTVCSVDPVSQSAILGYHQSALVCILHCSIRFRGQDEKATSNRNCCVADGNIGIGPIRSLQYYRWRPDLCMGGITSDNALLSPIAATPKKIARAKAIRECRAYGNCGQQRSR